MTSQRRRGKMGFHKLVNTAQFSYTARDFVKNGGKYTLAPKGSRDYKDFWDEEERRCQNGYSVGDLWIPGRHYFYLNHTPILKVPDADISKLLKESADYRGNISGITMQRVLEFPRFWEVDYEWYNYKYIAWHGGEFMGVKSRPATHLVCAKSRGAGFSYKEASDGIYNYTFIPESKSYYFAGLEQYLNVDGILNKADSMINFINEKNPEWKQNRMKSGTVMHQVASYLDAEGNTKGNKSEIIGVPINDPDKTRGKRGIKIVFEEAGSFKNLKKALSVCIGSINDGGITVGQISLFGTGGEEGPDIEGLEEIFDSPEAYGMLAFPNIWEEGMESSSCGYFVPCYRANNLFIDSEGNAEIAAAVKHELKEREVKKKAKDPKELDRRQAEYPIYPSEVFKRFTVNPFKGNEIKAHIMNIQTNSAIQSMIRYGRFMRTEDKGLVFVNETREQANPIIKYPHENKQAKEGHAGLEGCVTIYARPYLDAKGKVPKDMYFTVFDPYYKEESEDLTSLFAVYVFKQYNNIDSIDEGLPVASYIGRPEDLDTAYEHLFNLAEYYNSTVQGEIAGGGMGVLDYATRNKLLHLCEYEPEMLQIKEISNNKNRAYFMNMATEKKRMGLTYLIDWHKAIRSVNEKGNPILNIHRIYDIGLLEEMRKFDGKRNADRISACIVAMFMLKEKALIAAKKKRETDDDGFFSRTLFQGSTPTSGLVTPYG
jgi:hypothetical protein